MACLLGCIAKYDADTVTSATAVFRMPALRSVSNACPTSYLDGAASGPRLSQITTFSAGLSKSIEVTGFWGGPSQIKVQSGSSPYAQSGAGGHFFLARSSIGFILYEIICEPQTAFGFHLITIPIRNQTQWFSLKFEMLTNHSWYFDAVLMRHVDWIACSDKPTRDFTNLFSEWWTFKRR